MIRSLIIKGCLIRSDFGSTHTEYRTSPFASRLISRILFIIYFILLTSYTHAQDPFFSQFYASPIFLSPSFAGTTDGTRLAANYRDQWPQIPKAFTTYDLAIDHNLVNLNSGVGLLVICDSKGELDYGTTRASLVYSYKIKIKQQYYIRPGISFDYSYNTLNISNLITSDQVQYENPTPVSAQHPDKLNVFDAGTSVLGYNDRFWLGCGIAHLLRPPMSDKSGDRTPYRIDAFGAYKFIFHGHLLRPRKEQITVAFHYQMMGNFSQLDVGVMGFLKYFSMGLWYRGIPVIKSNPGQDAIIMSLGYSYQNIMFGFSHDFTISGLSSYSNGANEVSIIYLFNQDQRPKKNKRSIPCPTFYN